MATHTSTLAWKIPWVEEPGRLQSMGLLRVGHDFTFTHWRRKWQPTPVFLPGESHAEEPGVTESQTRLNSTTPLCIHHTENRVSCTLQAHSQSLWNGTATLSVE